MGGLQAKIMKGGANTALAALAWIVRIALVIWFCKEAFEIRLFAIKSYGLVIHEFDPWFNFRATQ